MIERLILRIYAVSDWGDANLLKFNATIIECREEKACYGILYLELLSITLSLTLNLAALALTLNRELNWRKKYIMRFINTKTYVHTDKYSNN